VDECISMLSTLDDMLADLRAEVQELSLSTSTSSADESRTGMISHVPEETPKPPKRPDYSSLLEEGDLPKARRLVNARQNAVKAVKATLAKRKAAIESRP
jgi:hypothetical protein